MPWLMDITPDTDTLLSDQAKQLAMDAALAELFDNSFDKKATLISVKSGEDLLEITDDGLGVTDLQAMLTRGRRTQSRERRIGRHAVGFKNSATWLSAVVAIDTRHANMRKMAEADWDAIRASRRWQLEAPEARVEHGDSFTTLTFTRLLRNRLRQYQSPVMRAKLAHIYRPALLEKKRIILDGESLQASPLPRFKKKRVIEGDLEGKHFRLTIGIKAEDEASTLAGYDVAYLYRIIVPHDKEGFGDYSASRVYGYLELLTDGEDWSLSEYKQEFAERFDLYEILLPKIEDLLKEASAHDSQIEVEGAKQIVIDRLSSLAKAKGKGPKKDKPVENPRGPYQKHERTEPKKKPRSLDDRLSAVGFRISYDLDDPHRVGEVSYRNRNTVCMISLNRNYDIVQPNNADSVIALCCSLIAMDWVRRKREEDPGEIFDFGELDASNPIYLIESLSQLLKQVLPADDRKAAHEEVGTSLMTPIATNAAQILKEH
jgi:hypothetical protein